MAEGDKDKGKTPGQAQEEEQRYPLEWYAARARRLFGAPVTRPFVEGVLGTERAKTFTEGRAKQLVEKALKREVPTDPAQAEPVPAERA